MQQKALSLIQFQKWFSTEKACEKQWFRLRWPEGFRCPAVNIVRPISIAPAQFFGSGGFLEIRVQLRLSVRTSHSLFPNSSKFRLLQGDPSCVAYRDCVRGKPSSKPCRRRAIFTPMG